MERGFSPNTCEILKKALPQHSRRGPGGTYMYYKGSDVIKRLNEAFTHSWSSEKLEEKVIDDQVLVLVSISVLTAGGEIVTHHGYGSAEIKRHGSSNKIINIGNVYKSAYTNALKKAAEQFGIGLGEDEEEEEVVSTPAPPRNNNSKPSYPGNNQTAPRRTSPPNQPTSRRTGPPQTINTYTGAMNVPGRTSKSAAPASPPPMMTPDTGDLGISDAQKKALHNLAKLKKRSDMDLIKGAIPNTNKDNFNQLLRSEAIEVIKYANTLTQGQ